MVDVVGTIHGGIVDLKSVFSKINVQKHENNGLTLMGNTYVVERLPMDRYHFITEYDLKFRGIELPISIGVQECLGSQDIMLSIDKLLDNDVLKTYMVYDSGSRSVRFWHYDIKMLELIYSLNGLMKNEFYLRMKDHWEPKDYTLSRTYDTEIAKKEKELESLYNIKLEFRNINEVFDEVESLKALLSTGGG